MHKKTPSENESDIKGTCIQVQGNAAGGHGTNHMNSSKVYIKY